MILSLFLVRERNQPLGFVLAECEWLLHIDVASPFQAKRRDIEMAFRRRRNVNNIGLAIAQQLMSGH